MTLQQQLNKFLREHGTWISKGHITGKKWQNEKTFACYLPETVGRTLRDLESNKKIAVKYVGKNTMYHTLPESKRDDYIPTAERTSGIYWKSKLI